MSERQLRLLVVDNAADGRRVREMLAAVDGAPFAAYYAETLVGALDALAHHKFDIALVEISLEDSQGLGTFETILRHTPGMPVVIHTGMANESLALTAVKRGAQDYLMKGKITSQALVRVLQYSVMRQQGQGQSEPKEAPKARVIGVVGAKGGVGVTTIAAHLSVEFRQQTGGRVLLLDSDSSSTSAAFLMNLESRYTVVDAATNLNRLDETFWEGVVVKGPDGLDVLEAPGTAGFLEPLGGERLRHVVRFARTMYDHIVADLGRLTPVALSLLEEINEFYVISTSGMPEIYETGRVIKKLLESGLNNNQVRLIMNRVPKAISLFGSNSEYFAKAVGFPVHLTIFDCAREIETAYAAGRFLDQGLPLRRQLAQTIANSLGTEQKSPTRGLLGLFKLART